MIMTIKKWFNIIPFFVKAAVSSIENGGFFCILGTCSIHRVYKSYI